MDNKLRTSIEDLLLREMVEDDEMYLNLGDVNDLDTDEEFDIQQKGLFDDEEDEDLFDDDYDEYDDEDLIDYDF